MMWRRSALRRYYSSSSSIQWLGLRVIAFSTLRVRTQEFHGLNPSDKANLTSQKQIWCAAAQCWKPHMARRTCFREQYYTGMIRYNWGREDSGPGPKKTMCENLVVFHWYLGMHQFVWARAFCEIRISCPAAVDCNVTIRKIHMRKIELEQGLVHDDEIQEFHGLRPSDKAKVTF